MASLKWPRNDLDSSIKVPEAMVQSGHKELDARTLAALLGYKTHESGTFANRLGAAKMFGLVAGNSPRMTVTPLASRIVQPVYPEDALDARFQAFLKVPLFEAFFNEYQARPLPPDKRGIENALVSQFGIEEKHAPAARVKMVNSAEQAGVLQKVGDQTRMMRPKGPTPSAVPVGDVPTTAKQETVTYGLDAVISGVPAVIQAALETVPWNQNLSKEQIDELAQFVTSAMRLHFRLSTQEGKGVRSETASGTAGLEQQDS